MRLKNRYKKSPIYCTKMIRDKLNFKVLTSSISESTLVCRWTLRWYSTTFGMSGALERRITDSTLCGFSSSNPDAVSSLTLLLLPVFDDAVPSTTTSLSAVALSLSKTTPPTWLGTWVLDFLPLPSGQFAGSEEIPLGLIFRPNSSSMESVEKKQLTSHKFRSISKNVSLFRESFSRCNEPRNLKRSTNTWLIC